MRKLLIIFSVLFVITLFSADTQSMIVPQMDESVDSITINIYEDENADEPIYISEPIVIPDSREIDFDIPEDLDIPPEDIYIEVVAGDEVIVDRSPLDRPSEPMATSVDIGNGTDDIFMDGQVGIGTSSPTSALEIVEGGNDVAIEFDGGSDFITIHDGYGNFNILSGLDYNNNIVGSSGGGTRLEMSEGGYFDFEIYNSTPAITNHLFIGQSESYFDGANVGIGTSSPGNLLEVDGQASYSSTSDMGSNDADFAHKQYVDNAVGGLTDNYLPDDPATSNVDMNSYYLLDVGRVDLNSGENIDDDRAILDCGYVEFVNKENDDILAQDGVMYWDASEGWQGYDGGGYRTFITDYQGETEDLTVRLENFYADNRIGIGTTSPDQQLTIQGTSDQGELFMDSGDEFHIRNDQQGNEILLSDGSGGIRFEYADNEIMRIDGNVGIGTTTPGYKLDVNADMRGRDNIYFGTSGAYLAGDNQGGSIELGPSSSSSATPFIDFHYGTGSSEDNNMRIINDGDGRLTISGASSSSSGNYNYTFSERCTNGAGAAETFVFPSTPTGATSNATLTVWVRGDIDNASEYWTIRGEGGTLLGNIPNVTLDFSYQCGPTYSANFTISQANINSWAGSGSISITGTSSSSTGYCDPNECIYMRLTYSYAISDLPELRVLGDLNVSGSVSKGSGSFVIDHPLDPENKDLYHSFVESPDMLNVYNGNVILDKNGEATVELPEYFEALNIDYRYQLTAIGKPGPELYIKEEIVDNRFVIAGGKPQMKVSWQVTGVRNDPYARDNRIIPEVEKENPGQFRYPGGYEE